MLERLRSGRTIAPEQVTVARKVFGGKPIPIAEMRSVTLYKLNLDDSAPAHAALALAP
jgi:hypothetical protein